MPSSRFKRIDKALQKNYENSLMLKVVPLNYRPLLPVNNYAELLDGLHKERDVFFEEVATFTLNSDKGNVERDAATIIELFNT